ncbi:hypothetical protein LNV09_06600 [Paucibacter sp. B2R-40]|uniref:hypothetical protein n=1 Tax=Paucibacter sp. B2R-40 TaxID=2893554 RepID=UPI0021E49585|nr:hypothetical protein [Paucibacter sp. B2R-40]MCV2353833.1 hypothetical protein [Paucibacter sp. B2R-40]
MIQPHHAPTPARQFWLACWLALVLLSFQTLGHLHRHAHAHGGTVGVVKGVSALDGWGHQSGDLSCQLFDQLSQDHATGGQFSLDATAPMHVLPAATPWVNGAPASYWKRGARGPPLWA